MQIGNTLLAYYQVQFVWRIPYLDKKKVANLAVFIQGNIISPIFYY